MAAHTEGPWNVDPRHPGDIQAGDQEIGIVFSERDAGRTMLIPLTAPFPCHAEAQANARLFAAAPQMLEALKDARENIATRFGADAANNLDADLIDKIDAAISAAEGQD